MSKHTPGPWHVMRAAKPDNVGGYDCAVVTPDRLILAEAFERPSRDVTFPAEANARLIAAAPELLEVCKDALATIGKQSRFWDDPIFVCLTADLEAAIRAAEGEGEGE